MAVPSITDLKMWVGTLFTKDDWDFNFSQIVDWLSGGSGDLVVNSLKATNGLDMDGAQISNLGVATTGSQAITLDQANTLLNRTSYYYPFTIASGKVDSNGNAAFLQKDSDTQVTVLAGNVNPDLVCIQSDGTIESVTSNTVLTVPVSDGIYHIIKEKEQAITITTGASGKVTVDKKYPTAPNIGDYFLDDSVIPLKGYKYTASGWEETAFCWLGNVSVSSGVATVETFAYNGGKNWVVSESATLFNSKAVGSYTFSVEDYLPKDGCTYEVLFDVYGGTTSNNIAYLQIKTIGDSTVSSYYVLTDKQGSSADGGYSADSFILPVKNRTISVQISGAAFSSMTIKAYAYKKV